MKTADLAIIIPALGAVIASFFFTYTGTGSLNAVNLKGDGGEWVFPADAIETVTVSGPLGDTVIEINEGTAHVVSSPCINQTCVAAGMIHSPGQWAACLPNRVMLYISSGAEDDVDASAW